ncbi:rhomboid family intramembrane serine protease [Frigidibacter sp. MR17.14]|uniref:rhomboid family intramembrane serine protease n=1 Tax=Frigidibacter sp. MR17.14 TaxID=3126509 RepID=UPI003012D561
MFPIRDHNPSRRPAHVTRALIALNVLVFLLTWPAFSSGRGLLTLWADWALIPAAVTQGYHWYTLVTSMFLHAGLLHIAGNMLFLWIFGDNLEDEMGPLRFLAFYLACGILSAMAHVASNPGSVVPTVGASGAIAGVMGAYLLMFPRARIDVLLIFIIFFKVIQIRAWAVLGIWFALQLLQGAANDPGASVAYWAHAGGFVAGALLVLPLWLRRGGPRFWARTQGAPPHPAAGQLTRVPLVPRRRR